MEKKQKNENLKGKKNHEKDWQRDPRGQSFNECVAQSMNSGFVKLRSGE